MNDEERRQLLEDVARGEITPEDAANRLRGGDDDSNDEEPEPRDHTWTFVEDDDDDEPAVTTPAPGATKRLRIEASAAKVEVIGDPTIAEAVAQGDCTMHRDGDTLVISTDPVERFQGFGIRIHGRKVLVDHPDRVKVRVNPTLPLELDVNAGAITVKGVDAPVSCEVNAGAVKLKGLSQPVNARVNAGSLKWSGRLSDGASTVSCDAGSVSIHLDDDSDVRVRARCELGKCSITAPTAPVDGEVVLGRGTGTLDVTGTVSSIAVHCGQLAGVR